MFSKGLLFIKNPFLFTIPHETDEFGKHPFCHVPKLFIYISNIKSEVKFKIIVIIVKLNKYWRPGYLSIVKGLRSFLSSER